MLSLLERDMHNVQPSRVGCIDLHEKLLLRRYQQWRHF